MEKEKQAQSSSAANKSGEESQAHAGSVTTAGVAESTSHKLDGDNRKQQGSRDEKVVEKEKEKHNKSAENENTDSEGDKKGKALEKQDKQWAEKMSKDDSKSKMASRNETSESKKTPHSSAIVITQDSESSSDSDSSSHSTSSSEMKNKMASKEKNKRQKKDGFAQSRSIVEKDEGKLHKREVSEPSAAAVTEEEPDSESSMALPAASGAEPENSEVPVEEVSSLSGWGCAGIGPVSLSNLCPSSLHQSMFHLFNQQSNHQHPPQPKDLAHPLQIIAFA